MLNVSLIFGYLIHRHSLINYHLKKIHRKFHIYIPKLQIQDLDNLYIFFFKNYYNNIYYSLLQ